MEVRWVAGSSCRREGREEQIWGRKDIALANVVKMKLKLLSAGIVVGVILRVII